MLPICGPSSSLRNPEISRLVNPLGWKPVSYNTTTLAVVGRVPCWVTSTRRWPCPRWPRCRWRRWPRRAPSDRAVPVPRTSDERSCRPCTPPPYDNQLSDRLPQSTHSNITCYCVTLRDITFNSFCPFWVDFVTEKFLFLPQNRPKIGSDVWQSDC